MKICPNRFFKTMKNLNRNRANFPLSQLEESKVCIEFKFRISENLKESELYTVCISFSHICMRYEKLEDGAMMCCYERKQNNNLCILVFHSLCIYVWKNRANVDVCVQR